MLPFLDGCESCERKLAVYDVEFIGIDGEVLARAELCAYCEPGVNYTGHKRVAERRVLEHSDESVVRTESYEDDDDPL